MLSYLLKSIIKNKNRKISRLSNLPIEQLIDLKNIHQVAPIDFHMKLLFDHVMIGNKPFLSIFYDCIAQSTTQVSPWKNFIRAQSALNLTRYFLYSLDIPGARAECGVFQGFSSLLLGTAAKLNKSTFTGNDLFLIDSFQGFPEPTDFDAIPRRDSPKSKIHDAPAYNAGDAKSSYEEVCNRMSSFPDATIIKGWIPEVFNRLPETLWSFVHIDVDLHAPTLACLDYFYRRLAGGGILLCDDYGSMLFPGAKIAWDEFFRRRELPFVVLETGQSVFVNQ